MGDHLLQAIAESAVHATPLLIVWATITPVQMVILRIPLVIEIKATISGVGNEAWWDLLRRRDGIRGQRRAIPDGLAESTIQQPGTICQVSPKGNVSGSFGERMAGSRHCFQASFLLWRRCDIVILHLFPLHRGQIGQGV